MDRIVILSGAGLSAESGLGTFRDVDGLWTQYDLSEVATPEGFARNPGLVHDFYNARRASMIAASPNAAHAALARIAARPGVTLVTQNVDDLLERAGAAGVVHMHGELSHALCNRCGARWAAPAVMTPEDTCPDCGACTTRPDIVWFGEIPYHMEAIEAALVEADLFVSIGTSGTVYPAAGFVDLANRVGARTLEINLEASGGVFDDTRLGPATETVPAWVAEILSFRD